MTADPEPGVIVKDGMTDAPLFTLREIARHLGIPESTVRYYRDTFAPYLPTVGAGRRRRYPSEAVEAMRLVARGFAEQRGRGAIEQELAELAGPVPGGGAEAEAAPRMGNGLALLRESGRDEVIATILDGERERREAMWQIAREIFRLGETLERHQVLLNQLLERVASVRRALPAPATDVSATPSPAPEGASVKDAAPPPDAALSALREELARERELVERLRRSKLDIERRAAEAEARLRDAGYEPGAKRPGLLDRLLTRDESP